MRLKEFIIFIIIFTIVYFLLFAVYDYFNLKKTNEKYIKKKNEALNYDRFILFALSVIIRLSSLSPHFVIPRCCSFWPLEFSPHVKPR